MNVQEVRSLAHGDRIRENGRGGKEGVVECVSDKYLRIRWEGGDSTEVDLANALECSYWGCGWFKLDERPTPASKGREPGSMQRGRRRGK